RKNAPSKEGKLGVEGIAKESILAALRKAGVTACEESDRPQITKLDLYNDGLSGGRDSAALRRALLKSLDLPERLSANALVEVINAIYTLEQYQNAVKKIKG
ncbi:MAG: DUF4093 domain-containing protein, partial [Acetanaerobacterium sp.]